MDEPELTRVVGQVGVLVEAHYVFPDVAAAVSRVLADGLADGRYPADARSLATVVTADLQSVNGDKHLRLLYHEQALPQRTPGDDTEDYAAMARWAALTCGGVACVQRLAGNVGYLDLQPVLFPAAISGESITAAMILMAGTDALIIDLRHCLGGEPAMTAFIISYLWDHEPAQLSGLRERSQLKQAWTLPYVPGGRFYDLQQLGRATVVGERTRGGAHAREGFTVHPHLEATVSVAEAVNPKTSGNWEGTGVTPDLQTPAAQARDTAYRRALQDVTAAGGSSAAEAQTALAATQADPG
jgi:N-terminal domain of Peptidase_S41 in eukaryotic IRBP